MSTKMVVHNFPATEPAPLPDPKEQWLEERRTFIGGSDVYKLLNERQYGQGCVRALAYEKLNFEPDFPDQQSSDEAQELQRLFKRGHIMEEVADHLYEEETGRRLRRPPMDEHGLPRAKRHPEYPWAGVHVDRIVLAGSGGVTETGSAEIKSRGEGPYLQLLRKGLFPGDNLQIQQAMWVNNHTWGPFITVGVFGGLPLKHFDVKRDEPTIEIIKREGDRFAEQVWVKNQLPDQPFPGTDDRCKVCTFRMECRGEEIDAQAAAMLRAEKAGKTPLVHISNVALAQALADRVWLKQEIKAHEELIDVVDIGIKRELGTVEGAMVDGFGKVYHKLQAGRTTAELGKMMQYLRDVSAPAAKLAGELERIVAAGPTDFALTEVAVLAQAITVLKNLEVVPATVSLKYTKVGEPFAPIRTYPLNATATQ